MLGRLGKSFSQNARAKRGALLRSLLDVDPSWSILDLGGGTGDHIAAVFPGHRNITVSDYSERDLEIAKTRHGFKTVLADGTATLPFADQSFDLVFCSSVIEHVTGPKAETVAIRSGRAFRQSAEQHQAAFANEIRRVGKRYYVQTPHKLFVLESHSWLPLPFALLPRPVQIPILRMSGKVLPKSTAPDWHLLMPNGMQALFPEAEIRIERYAGLPKSIMAITGHRQASA